MALQAPEPLPLATEPGGRVGERHEFVDIDPRTVGVLHLIDQPHAIMLRYQCDRTNSVPA
jgi:hypothetical protein